MRKSVIAAAVSAAGIAATVIGTAVASASGAAPTEHFLGLNNNPNTNGVQAVVAQGPIHATGKDVVVSGHKDRFVFPNGSITVVHHKVGKDTQSFDRVTCYGTFGEHGTYTVTRGSGAYVGAHGTGTYRLVGKVVGCSQNKPPRIFQVQLVANGPLSV